MRVLWLCNMVPSAVRGNAGGGLWVDHVLSDLYGSDTVTLHILCRGHEVRSGNLNQAVSFEIFPGSAPEKYCPELEAQFAETLKKFSPDVIHIWGTEYSHTLAMVQAADSCGMLSRVAVSIQGLCSRIAEHYTDGLPAQITKAYTLRDLLRRDNIRHQAQVFDQRGELEVQALQKVRHVIGRTHWDRSCTAEIAPERIYHTCNETMREPFYTGAWNYASCTRHRIFASSCAYPVKGFHYLLEAVRILAEKYTDISVTVTGDSFLTREPGKLLRQGSYHRYLASLARTYHLQDQIHFLGKCSAEQMKAAYLDANVFVLPSTIENSPNSLGEAMLLGVPCVAADVGGVRTMLQDRLEGFLYLSMSAKQLANCLDKVFAMEEQAAQLGAAAHNHASGTHEPAENLNALLQIYESIMKGN